MTEMVEIQRVDLTEEQALTVKTLTKAINGHQARYGQLALGVDQMKAQFEQSLVQLQKDGEEVKGLLQEASQDLQSFSARLAEEFELNLSDGVWSLNVDEACFVQTKKPEDISVGRTLQKKGVKRTLQKKAAKRVRSRSR